MGFTTYLRMVGGSYMPGAVAFMTEAGDSTCPAGNWLRWESGDFENNKAIYAALLTAHASRQAINFYHCAGSCTGAHLHVTD